MINKLASGSGSSKAMENFIGQNTFTKLKAAYDGSALTFHQIYFSVLD